MRKLLTAMLLVGCLCAQHTTFLSKGRTDGGSGLTSNADHLRIDTVFSDDTWTAPAGITDVQVEAWGAGAGASAGVGGGGGGERCWDSSVTVVPTTGYAVVVGESAADTNGEASSFDSTTVTALGGLSGANGGTGGTGGTGEECFAGGNAELGSGDEDGGGGAGDTQAGSNGNPGDHYGGIADNQALDRGRDYASGGASGAAAEDAGRKGLVRVTYDSPVSASFPVVKARAAYRLASSSATHNVDLPSGITAGDLLYVGFATDDEADIDSITEGWTTLFNVNRNDVRCVFFYKIAEGSDELEVTLTQSQRGVALSGRMTGVGGTPDATTANNTSSTPDPPSHSPSGGSGDYYWITLGCSDEAGSKGSGTVHRVSAIPSGYADFLFLSGESINSAFSSEIFIAGRHATGSSEDPGTFTVAGSTNWVAATIAIPGN